MSQPDPTPPTMPSPDAKPMRVLPLEYASPRTNAERPHGSAGRVLGLIFFSGILTVVLLITLAPSHSPSRPRADIVMCASNLRQIGQGLVLYLNDHPGRYPPSLDLLILHADINAEVFICPQCSNDIAAQGTTTQQVINNFNANPRHCSYVYLAANQPASAVSAGHIVAHEKTLNHFGGMNFLFGDGHVERFEKQESERLLKELKAGHNPPRPAP